MDVLDRRSVMMAGVSAAVASLYPAGVLSATTSKPLSRLSLTEASAQIRAREVTSVALTQSCLDRIQASDRLLNALITVSAESALTTAQEMDAELRAGRFRGSLHGLPIILKDNIDTRGTRTTAASQIFDDRIPEQDAFVVQLLREAGAVILGKANMHEFAMGRTSATSYFGPVHNPWALDRISAGSSGGCAAAVISDMCLAAVGTDTGGSARMPAAYCSVVGLKPTCGLISMRGIIPLAYSFDNCGPMTKTVEDTALLLNTLVRYDEQDDASVEHVREDYVQAIRQPIAGFRLGIPKAPFFDNLDPQIAAAVNAAIELLRGMTAGTRVVAMPATNALDLSEGSPLNAEIISAHQDLLRYQSAGYSISIKRRLQDMQKALDNVTDESASEKVVAYIRAYRDLLHVRKTIDDAFVDFDLLVLPTMRVLPPKIADIIERDETTTPKARQPERDNNCSAFNIWGIPAISVPCGFSSEGLPIGLMIAGPRYSEGKVLALAHAYERATRWHERRPALGALGPLSTKKRRR